MTMTIVSAIIVHHKSLGPNDKGCDVVTLITNVKTANATNLDGSLAVVYDTLYLNGVQSLHDIGEIPYEEYSL